MDSRRLDEVPALLCSGWGRPGALRVSVPGLPPGSAHSPRETKWTFPVGGMPAILCAMGSCKPSPGTALPPSAIQPDSLARQGLLRRVPRVPAAAETWHPQAAPAPPSRSSLFCAGAPTHLSSRQLAGFTCHLPVLILSLTVGRILFGCPLPTGSSPHFAGPCTHLQPHFMTAVPGPSGDSIAQQNFRPLPPLGL